jgi:hypothetical protein
VNRSTLSRR